MDSTARIMFLRDIFEEHKNELLDANRIDALMQLIYGIGEPRKTLIRHVGTLRECGYIIDAATGNSGGYMYRGMRGDKHNG